MTTYTVRLVNYRGGLDTAQLATERGVTLNIAVEAENLIDVYQILRSESKLQADMVCIERDGRHIISGKPHHFGVFHEQT